MKAKASLRVMVSLPTMVTSGASGWLYSSLVMRIINSRVDPYVARY